MVGSSRLSSGKIENPTFFAIFHSVSAFCNAGFSTLPENLNNPVTRSLYGFQCWIAVLIILGGIGFPIVFNYGKLFNHKIRNLIYRLQGSSQRMPSQRTHCKYNHPHRYNSYPLFSNRRYCFILYF